MSDNLDDWLNSLGLETPSPAPDTQLPQPVSLEEPEPEVIISPAEAQNISSQEFSDIIDAIGLNIPEQYDEAVEVEEVREEEEEEEENTEESRDLDAEEDADWQADIDSGVVVPVDSPAVPQEPSEMPPVPPESPSTIESNAIAPAPFIQPNSPTLLIDDSTSRFSGTEWYNEIQKQRIIIAGCGGIGRMKIFS